MGTVLAPFVHLALDNVLIRDEITSSLHQADLASCTLVSWSWNEAFSPILWKTLYFRHQQDVAQFQTNHSFARLGGRTLSPMQEGLIRNKRHVRFIHSYFCYTFQTSLLVSQPEDSSRGDALLEQPFPSLIGLDTLASELHNKGIVDTTNTERLLQFVTLNISLSTLTLSNFPLASVEISRLLGTTLETHPNLDSVNITCFKSADRSSIRHVLRGAALGKVKKLAVICRSTVAWDDEPLSALEPNATSPFQLLPNNYKSGLKELTLEASLTHAFDKTLLPLLQNCPNLQQLHIPQLAYIAEDQDAIVEQELGPALKKWCPKLRNLDLGCSLATDKAMVSLLSNCSSLESLTFSSPLSMGPLSTKLLVDSNLYHSTLERLDIRLCTGVDSKDLQLLLVSCPNLTVFQSIWNGESNGGSESSQGGYGRYHGLHEARIQIQDLPLVNGPAWACRRLRVLHVGFSGFASLNDASDQSEIETSAIAHRYLDHIYSQLSKLTELRTLVLAGDLAVQGSGPTIATFEFSLPGGLDRLEPLRQLQELDLTKIPRDNVSDAEIVWMQSHWPRLQKVIGSNGRIHFDRAKVTKETCSA